MTVASSIELLDETAFDEGLPPSQSLMQQFEKMIVTTLLRSFALDFMIKDQDGGNVDTPLTAREYGLKEEKAQNRYQNKGDYNSNSFKGATNYKDRNKHASLQRDEGQLRDAYTGQKISRNEKYDLDHTIATKEIHEDPAVYLVKLNGVDLANSETNLNHTNYSINRSKKQKKMTEFLTDLDKRQAEYDSRLTYLKNQPNLTEKERGELQKLTNLRKANTEMMKEADEKARREYNKTITKAYLSDKDTYMNVGKDALKTGGKMAVRQALGIILAEVWVIARQKFPIIIEKMRTEFSLKEFFIQVVDVFREAFEKVKMKFKDLIASFADGLLAGLLSSVSTFIINFFTSTAKRVVKMIRDIWGSITQIFKLLVFNPDQLPPGELIRAISKIIVLAVAVLAGNFVAQALEEMKISELPVIGEALTIFLSGLTTGVISISLIYFIDHSNEVEKLVNYLNIFADQFEAKRIHYQKFNDKLKQKVSELAQLPLEELNKQLDRVTTMTSQMNLAATDEQLNSIVSKTANEMQLALPYQDRVGLKQLMNDESLTLHFE
ncbi:hypothetical protein [Gottfriedia acidiceleris]|uniref:Uncharacterized protein n=1 Tax=Gottfriedia acidiceleris TaxID=371036 RepID=A0ABY4JRE0_9BACI|nr:hypothetical protein [Gottfriedia acidiceleris]UPM56369.1 hypothetical protein MY490_11250 [Gottfriedia acidiceleris]